MENYFSFPSTTARKSTEDALLDLESIHTFWMTNNALSTDFLIRLARKCLYDGRFLKSLHLDRISFNGQKDAIWLAKYLSRSKNFHDLSLNNSKGLEGNGSFFCYLAELRCLDLGTIVLEQEDFLGYLKNKINIAQSEKETENEKEKLKGVVNDYLSFWAVSLRRLRMFLPYLIKLQSIQKVRVLGAITLWRKASKPSSFILKALKLSGLSVTGN